ncbi:MAG: hypothetical protein R3F15_18355 [Lysobacterales bacterium]
MQRHPGQSGLISRLRSGNFEFQAHQSRRHYRRRFGFAISGRLGLGAALSQSFCYAKPLHPPLTDGLGVGKDALSRTDDAVEVILGALDLGGSGTFREVQISQQCWCLLAVAYA